MTANQVIMVQVANHKWNKQALYYACTLARRGVSKIVLVKMIPVQHIAWLGTEFGNLNLTNVDRIELEDCAATVEDYGVEYSTLVFQYATLPDALLDAADYVQANVVFATLPCGLFPWWDRLRSDTLRRQFAKHQRVLIDKASLFEEAKPQNNSQTIADSKAYTPEHRSHTM